MIRLSCQLYLQQLDNENFYDPYFKAIDSVDELIKQNDIQSILDITKEFKNLFLIKEDSQSHFASKNGKLIPESNKYNIYQLICEKLLDSDKTSEAFTIAEYMLENNQIAKVHIYYINRLVENGNIDLALKNLPEIINFIESSNPELQRNWPDRGYSLLKIVDFYIKISDLEEAQKYIDIALLEMTSEKIHLYNEPTFFSTDTLNIESLINEDNKAVFLCNVINRLLTLGEIDQSIDLLKDICPEADGYQESLFNIAWKIFDNDDIKSFKLIFENNNIDVKNKREFYSKFFSRMGFEKNILTWKHYFKDDIESFILPLSGNFLNNLEVDSDYIYLSNFSEHTKELSNILSAKSYEYITSKTKPDEEKLDLLSQVIDIDEWRKISTSI